MARRVDVLPTYSRHVNWQRVASGLRHLQPVLERFVDSHIRSLHANMIQSLNAQGLSCTNNCCVRTLTPQHAFGHVCIHSDRRKCQCRVRNANPCPTRNICGKIYDRIVQEHAQKDPLWQNTTASRWASNYWEFAKCFLSGSGYTNRNSAAETDVPGLLSICLNCNTIRATINVNQFSNMRQLRHDIMHAAVLDLSSADMQNIIQNMTGLLLQPPFVSNPDAQAALRSINGLPDTIHYSVPTSSLEEFKKIRKETIRVLKEILQKMVRAGKLTKGASILANTVTAAAGLACLYLLFTAPPAAAPAADITLAVGRWVTLGIDCIKLAGDEYYSHKIKKCVQDDIKVTHRLLRQLRRFENELTSDENHNIRTLMSSIEIGLFTPSEALGLLNPKNLAMELPKLKAMLDNVLILANTSVVELASTAFDKAVKFSNGQNTPPTPRIHRGQNPPANPGPPLPAANHAGVSAADNDMMNLLHVGKIVPPQQSELLNLQSGEYNELLQGNYRTALDGTPMYPNGLESLEAAPLADHVQSGSSISPNPVAGNQPVPGVPADVPGDKAPKASPKPPSGSDAPLNGEQIFDAAMTGVTVLLSGYKVYRDCKDLYNGKTSDQAAKLADAIAELERHMNQYQL